MITFWLGILFSLLFIWLAIKCGFYEIWIHLFNIAVSIYMAIFLYPFIKGLNIIPDTVFDNLYSNAALILITAAAAFIILYGISFAFFTSQFRVSTPRLFDVIGSGFLGFLAGQLVWSFLYFLLCITPLSDNTILQEIGFKPQLEQKKFSYMNWWVDRVNNLVSTKSNFQSTDKVVDEMLAATKTALEKEKLRQRPPIKRPVKTNEPNDILLPEIGEKDKSCTQDYEPNKSSGSGTRPQSIR